MNKKNKNILEALLGTLEVSNVSKSFDVPVIKNLSLIFERGLSYAIMGVSGSGKSTLLSLLSGLSEPTHGHVFYNTSQKKTDVFKLRAQEPRIFCQELVSLVTQSPQLLRELTVLENIMLKGIISEQEKSKNIFQAKHLLKLIGLEHKADSLPAALSLGQQQRVSIARGLFNMPAFLLIDEPTAHLDTKHSQEIMNMLMSYQKEHTMGLIITTHDTSIAQQCMHIHELKAQ